MGGYGPYVWGSYIMVVAALAWELMDLAHRRRRALADRREREAYPQ
jgi:heme exporter protein CcmD